MSLFVTGLNGTLKLGNGSRRTLFFQDLIYTPLNRLKVEM